MKKFLFAVALILAFHVQCAFCQTLFYEGFETTAGNSLPDGWTSIGYEPWTVETGVYNGQHPSSAYAGSKNAQLHFSSSGYGAKLITPSIDCSGNTSVILTFAYVNAYFYGSWDKIKIYYRTSPTDTWHQIDHITGSHDSWVMSDRYIIPTSSSTFQLAFEIIGEYGYGVGIDEVTLLTGPTCFVPENLIVTAARASVTASWTANGSNCVGYNVKLSTSSNPDDAAVDSVIITGSTTTTYTFNHLERETSYYVHVRSNCGATDGYSDWVTASVTTDSLIDCSTTVEVADGDVTSEYIPIYGYNCNETQKSQSIYPANMLTGLVGKSITKLKYYLASVTSSNGLTSWCGTFTVRMMHTTATSVSGILPTTDATSVYTGTLTASRTDGMTIDLTTPFTYTGGNLLIEFDLPIGCGYNTSIFYGSTVDSASYQNNDSIFVQNFLPKVSFGYCVPINPCPAVDTVIISDITQSTATISWTASTGDYANTYDVLVSERPITDFTAVTPRHTGLTATSDTIQGLYAYQEYYVYVRVNCDGYGHNEGEAWSEAARFKTLSGCVTPTNVVVVPLSKRSARASWTSFAEQTSNCRYILSSSENDNPDVVTPDSTGMTGDTLRLENLTMGEQYYLYLSNACGGRNGNSPYVMTEFTMPDACIAPSNVAITNVEKYQMTLYWAPSAYADPADKYDIIVSESELANPSTAAITYHNVTGNSKVLNFLNRNTTYYIYIRCNCGATLGNTEWISVTAKTQGLASDCDNTHEIAVGGTDTAITYYLPAYENYRYSLSEQIYDAAEINQAGIIKGISFFCTNSAKRRNLKIYLAHTTKSTFSSAVDWIRVTDNDLVYSGNYQMTDDAWNEITFDTPFEYNGTDNLAIIVDDNTGSYAGSAYFYIHHTTGYKTLYYSDDSTNPNPSASYIPNGSRETDRNFVRFNFCSTEEACPAVAAPVATDITNTKATITWNNGEGDFTTSYSLLISDTVVTDFETAGLTADNIFGTTYTDTSLTANTHYYVYVRVNCINNNYNDGSSAWSPACEFTTELSCLKPENFVAGEATSISIPLSWVETGDAENWKILVASDTNDTVDVNIDECVVVNDTIIYTLAGLNPKTTYTLHIIADCVEDSLSKEAIDTISFTTLDNSTDVDTLIVHNTEVISYTIDHDAKTIDVVVRKGTEIDNLYADLITHYPSCRLEVDGEEYVSPWDFTDSVTIHVISQDTNFTSDWRITIVEEECATLYDFIVSDIERRTANLSWHIGDATTSFDLVLSEWPLGNPEWGYVQSITATNDAGFCTYPLTGLTRGTHYYIYLRTHCDTAYAQWRFNEFTTKSLIFCEDVIVADGTATNDFMPIYGLYYDIQGVQTQFVYSSDMLTALRGKSITKMTFFSTNETYNFGNAQIQVSVGITPSDDLSSGFATSPSDTVYTGYAIVSNYQNVIQFATPFDYPAEGGNLLIEYKLTTTGYNGPRTSFYGITTDKVTGHGNKFNAGSQTFLPKVQFNCCEESVACPEVTDVTVSDVDVNSATVTWTESTGDYANTSDVYYSTNEVTDFTAITPQITGLTGNSAVLTGLEDYTIYYVYVRTHCDGENHDDGLSEWTEGIMFRTLSPCRVPSTPEATITGKHTATVAWSNTSGYAAQANNFTYVISDNAIAMANLGSAVAITGVDTVAVDLTGLDCETTYHFYVKNECTGDVNCSSPWDSCQFTMPEALPAVINVQVFDIASNAFTATWESDTANFANETQWEVACVASGDTPTEWTVVTTRSHIVLGLNPITSYDFYVRATDGNNHSENAMINATTIDEPTDCHTIGEGTNTQHSIPCANFYHYGYSQQIFDTSELQSGEIRSIAFQYGYNIPMTKTNVKIFLGHTSKSSFSSTADWVSANDLTEVYSGSFNCSGDGVFNSFKLTTPFEYNDTDNLVVAVHKESYDYEGQYYKFRCTGTTDNKTLYYQNDNYACPVNSPVEGTLLAERNNIEFCYAPADCRPVTNIKVDHVTTSSAHAYWYPGNEEQSWQIYNAPKQMTVEELDTLSLTNVITNQVNLSDLDKDMDYYLYVRGHCSGEESSPWMEYHYTTLPTCSAPSTTIATSATDNSITFMVTSGEYGTEGTYDYRYWAEGSTDTVTLAGQTSEVTINGLQNNVTYIWEVRANCSGTDDGSSRWVVGNPIHVCGVASLPYTEGFEHVPASYSGPGMIETICWSDLNASASSYPDYHASTSYATEGRYSLQTRSNWTTPMYLILPSFGDVTDVCVMFDCGYQSLRSSGNFQVGYITDPTDPTTFVSSYTASGSNSYSMDTHTAYVRNIPTGAKVAICHTPNGYADFKAWLDNIRIDTVPTYTVSTAVSPEVTPALGVINIANSETDTASPGVFYEATAPVLTAIPAEGMMFTCWTNGNNGDTITVDNPWTMIVMQDTSIIANFDTASFDLTVSVAEGSEKYGSVIGSGNYKYMSSQEIAAMPIMHYHTVWNDGNTDNIRTIIMPSMDTTFVASFIIDQHTVSANIIGEGTVEGLGMYNYGATAVLVATPDDGYKFAKWIIGDSTFTNRTLVLVITEDVTVTAEFTLITVVDNVEEINFVAYSEEKDIVVCGAGNYDVTVYDMTGRLVKKVTKASEVERINVYAAGVYIIRIDNRKSLKVIVK